MSNTHLKNWHKYAPCLPTGQAGPRHFVVTSDYLQRNKFRFYRTFRAYGSLDQIKGNSTGITQNNMDKIFQHFFTTKPTVSGTGLGLSLSYDIITQGHDGALEIESDEGFGTRFIIEIPLTT